ncbi:NAD(P)-binding domain-containing protein [Pseudomonas sp. zfem002]|nr:NAD(P)-binding domain-containing protein [Pseudomonas sp. zfem002]MDU9390192.1 NAD(P)-binding domain-containing protein [Pseudomonas sp. zfem002]
MNKERIRILHDNDCRSSFDVSVLGLGSMGTIMVHALLKQGKRVAIWNRSPGKADALVAAGAHLCESPQAALAASPVAILVLLDDAAAQQVLAADGVTAALAGRTIVNFTTNSEEQSAAQQALVNRAGGRYVKGMIIAYPRNVGRAESYCLYTGEQDAFEQHQPLLQALAGQTLFLPWGEALAFAAMLHAHMFTAMVTFYESVGASRHFGMSLPKTARLLVDASRFFVADALEDAARRFETEDFTGDQATIDVHAYAFEEIAYAMKAVGASSPVFDAACQVIQRAQAMGFGEQDISAASRVFGPAS